MNVVFLQGSLSSPPVRRELSSGRSLVSYEVTVRPDDGPVESVPVAWFDAPDGAELLTEGSGVVVTGRVRRRFFRANGATATRTEVVADAVVSATNKRKANSIVRKAEARLDAGTSAAP